MEQGTVYWDRVCSWVWERYLSQGRGLSSSRGTTLWVLLPASKHRARRISSFVLGSSCNLSRSRMSATISSTCRGESEKSQSFLLYFLPFSSLSTMSSNSRGLVAILSVTLFSRQSSGVLKARSAGPNKGSSYQDPLEQMPAHSPYIQRGGLRFPRRHKALQKEGKSSGRTSGLPLLAEVNFHL